MINVAMAIHFLMNIMFYYHYTMLRPIRTIKEDTIRLELTRNSIELTHFNIKNELIFHAEKLN